MKKIVFMLIFLYMGLMGANAQSNKYDLNEDGEVNVTDVTLLVTKILDQNNGNEYDLNDDEDVNITDVILMVNYILGLNNGNQGGGNGGGIGDTSQAYLTCPDDNHPHMIDLGLPSGTKWACCNVGATKPEEYGGYYAWGETEEKECYNPVTYLYSTGVDEDGDGYYDDLHSDEGAFGLWQHLGANISGTKYDVAHVKWGGNWCMPTLDEIDALVDNCSSVWTTENGVYGRRFTGPNGVSIFLPAAGERWDGDNYWAGGEGDYWSSTQSPDCSDCAYYLTFCSGYAYWDYYDGRGRFFGRSVRPVWKE